MGSHPINLGVRFLLEMAGLLAIGFWGWNTHSGLWRVLFGMGAPLLAAVLWGSFAVPDDPSRSGRALVPVPGWVRLLLELAFFAFAVWALFDLAAELWGWVLLVVTIIHYLTSYDRIGWLLRQ